MFIRRVHLSALLCAGACLAFTSSATAQEAKAGAPSRYRITFSGNQPGKDWAYAAKILVRADVVALDSVPAAEGDSVCNVALRELKFKSEGLGCSAEVLSYLGTINKGWDSKPGSLIYFPKLPVSANERTFTFATSDPGDVERAERMKTSHPKVLLVGQKSKGSFEQQTYKVFTTEIEVPPSPEAQEALRNLSEYDPKLGRLTISVEPVGKPRALGALHSRAATVSQWWQRNCSPGATATLPKPPFAGFLGLPSNNDCVTKCMGVDCPEIVLYDRAVAPHFDLTAALNGVSTPAPQTVPACSYVPWDDQYHGTHLAGIMVSQPGISSAIGLAPNAALTSLDNTKLALGGLADELDKHQLRAPRQIFVVASDFPLDLVKDLTFRDSTQRFSIPAINSGITNARNVLWVVAAGQPKTALLRGEEIGTKDNRSPMNLGDQPNVIVVTACEACQEDTPKLASWANYSDKLVSVAAPGGSPGDDVYSTASNLAYSNNYGTSQSAAFVAGLVAAMYSCDTQYNAINVKSRLEISATPVIDPLTGMRDPNVRSGVVNASAALRNRRYGMVRTKNINDTNISRVSWCFPFVGYQSTNGRNTGEPGIRADNIRRILKMGSAAPGQPPGFMVYDTNRGWTSGIVGLDIPKDFLVRVMKAGTSDYVAIKANDIEDLDVSTAIVEPVKECN